jgi:hypothetical protein
VLVEFLCEHWRMFAWCPADMPGIPRELAEHELKIFPNAKPVKQSMHRYNLEKARSMGEEINRLLEAKFIREIKEATWLSPPVMVEKKDTKIYRMCIDFTALNKHCLKDYFPLPRIDQIIDSTTGGLLLFDGAQLTREIILLCSSATVPEKDLMANV